MLAVRIFAFAMTSAKSPFSFGAPAAANNTSTGSLFSSTGNTNTGGFGAPATNTAASSGGLFQRTSSQPATSSTGALFGAPQQSNNSTGSSGFGSQTQANNTTGLFGSQGSAAPNPSGGGLFGSQSAGTNGSTNQFGTQQQGNNNAGGGLFGAQAQNKSTGGLFGAQSTSQAGGGLFGNQQPATGSNTTGSLFGTQQPAQSSNSLFGATQTAKPAGSTGGMFGQSTNSNAPGSGIFGQSNTGNSREGGLFGSSATNTQPNTLFGPPKTAASGFGASMFVPKTHRSSTTSASPLMQHGFYQRERYNELPENQRVLLDSVEKFIKSQTQVQHELRVRDSSDEMRQLLVDVHDLSAAQQSLSATLEADTMRLQTIAAKVQQDWNDNAMLHQVATHAKDKLSDGSSFLDWLRGFYERVAEEDLARIQRYRSTMEVRMMCSRQQLERHLVSINQREQFAPQGMWFRSQQWLPILSMTKMLHLWHWLSKSQHCMRRLTHSKKIILNGIKIGSSQCVTPSRQWLLHPIDCSDVTIVLPPARNNDLVDAKALHGFLFPQFFHPRRPQSDQHCGSSTGGVQWSQSCNWPMRY